METSPVTDSVVDFDHAQKVAVTAVEAAGALLREHIDKGLTVRIKDANGDVVTQLDVAAENLIMESIREAFPTHQIIAEESGVQDATDNSWTWLVDPMDGTNNVIIGLNVYVIGLALCKDRVPVLGVVHDPIAGQTWSAVRGRGTQGPAGLAVRRRERGGPVLAWTQGYSVDRADGTARALRAALELRVKRVLQLWAPLLCWVMLARGDIDGFVGYRPEAVDLPAGHLIAQEAGIMIRALDGSPFDEHVDVSEHDRSFVAAHPEVIHELLALVRAVVCHPIIP